MQDIHLGSGRLSPDQSSFTVSRIGVGSAGQGNTDIHGGDAGYAPVMPLGGRCC